MRLNKFVRDALRISRRKADRLIKEGKITVNEKILREPFYNTKENDVVKYGKRILKTSERKNTEIYIYYKPRGVVSSHNDPHAKRTVFSELNLQKGLKIAGRLDMDSEGLMIITNDGNLIQKLTHPSFETKKGYLVWTKRELTEREINKMIEGIEDAGEELRADRIIKKRGKNLYLFILHKGKKREIRRLLKRFNNEVIRLKRIFIGKYTLPHDMKPGEIRKIR